MSENKKHYFQFPQDYKSMSEADKEAALTEFADQIFDYLVSKQKDQS